ncbi:uncharacterized protein LOC127786199 isoform X1 [Oryza glaberrima]|nr:uncharacterized protein LOC127756881 isoform X1 [Oryza glaberrima]XP_052155089.1 uncharacterized protein LOC127773111 isoform X1 [Oryza glaberrima]XP_052169494.1 uncharacterized protein LOC127786199 isoform X1 [Oryza glaberrima]
MGRRRRPVAREPAQNEYERTRQEKILQNIRRMDELGIKDIAATIKHIETQHASSKTKNSGTKKSHGEGSDTSEYLPEDDEQGVQCDDDSYLEAEQPIPIMIEYPRQTRRKKCATKKKPTLKMPPGVRISKRVRAGAPTEMPPGVSTRSAKRQLIAEQGKGNGHEELPPETENNGDEDVGSGHLLQDNDVNRPPSPVMDWSYGHDANHEEQPAQQTNSDVEVPIRRGTRKSRPPTAGIMLDKMTKAMGRMPIAVAEGKKRPDEPVQAAKFSSEAGVIIRTKVPVFPHWKQYKDDEGYINNFMGKLSVRLAINQKHQPTRDACADVLQKGIRQTRYNLKKAYFNGVPANEIRTTSPISSMTDEQWLELVAKWSNPKNMQISEQNKQNRLNVRFHQATGSRSYAAHLHAYKEKNKVVELDAVDAFEDCHTSRKKGLSDAAKDAISSMKAIMEEPVPDGETPRTSAEVVSKVLSRDNSNTTFLKNAGLQMSSKKSVTPTEAALQEELAAEKQSSAILHAEVVELKEQANLANEALAKTQKELAEFKQQQEENNLLLRRILSLSQGNLNLS